MGARKAGIETKVGGQVVQTGQLRSVGALPAPDSARSRGKCRHLLTGLRSGMPLATIGSEDCRTKVLSVDSMLKKIEGKLLPFVGENPSEFCHWGICIHGTKGTPRTILDRSKNTSSARKYKEADTHHCASDATRGALRPNCWGRGVATRRRLAQHAQIRLIQ